ncbi:MAG: hypothetical protein H0X62_09220 [Bacteroidetes bacterium]|nr:hypothetical protein [Bacteroidota bacterium]
MKVEDKKIKLNLGTVSLAKELGTYYIDMRPAIIHYTENIWGGKFDEQGVPMISIKKKHIYFPINIAQYGFMLHADWLISKDDSILETLKNCLNSLEREKTETEDTCVWWHHENNIRYGIQAPWASAMAQGEVISFYLRMYQILNQEHLLNTAIKAYNFLKIDFKANGVRRYDNNGDLWFEEYPSEKPSFVLNGFIYAIFGLYDLYRVTGMQDVKDDIDACITTLKNNIEKFNVGYWSLYDLQKKELVRYYYQKNVHVPQMEVLYLLTQEPVFLKYKEKWEKQITPLNFLFVKLMYRIKPRLQKLKQMAKTNSDY